MSEPWEEAWEIYQDAAAEAAHARWMQTKQSHGFADHPFVPCSAPRRCMAPNGCHKPMGCDITQDRHHNDMIPFADLSPEIQAYDYDTAIIGFKFGFEAGTNQARRRPL